MDCSTPGLPVHHQLPELTQTHAHQVGDAIQPSYPLLSPSLPPSIFPSIRVFSNESVLHIRWTFSFSISPSNKYSGLISFRKDWLDLCAVHCWAYTPRKPELKETHVAQYSLQHCLQQLVHGSNLDVHRQTNG